MPATQYINRKFDILAFRGATERGEVRLNQSLFDSLSAGEVCTGAQKVAQRWALEFLTPLGSMGYHLVDRGTNFLARARNGRIRTELDVQLEYSIAATLVRQQMLADETDDMADEDRFGSDALLDIILAEGRLSLKVQILTLAGETREVILPINITPVNMSL